MNHVVLLLIFHQTLARVSIFCTCFVCLWKQHKTFCRVLLISIANSCHFLQVLSVHPLYELNLPQSSKTFCWVLETREEFGLDDDEDEVDVDDRLFEFELTALMLWCNCCCNCMSGTAFNCCDVFIQAALCASRYLKTRGKWFWCCLKKDTAWSA